MATTNSRLEINSPFTKGHHPQKTEVPTQKRFLYLAAILLITFVVFSTAINNDFVSWDDEVYLVENQQIRNLSWEGIRHIFTTPMGEYQVYRPLTYLTYALEYKLWGLHPKGYHIVSILLHLLCTTLIFRLMWLITHRLPVAVIVSLLFAIHPMRVESVAWILARVDVLYGSLYVAALICYVSYSRYNKGFSYYIFSLLLFTASLFAKPAAVSFPVLMVLFDYYFSRQLTVKLVMEKVPFFVFSFAFGIVTLLVQKGVVNDLENFEFYERIFLVSYAVVYYLVKLFLPTNLAISNPFPTKTDGILPVMYYVAPFVLALLAWGIYKTKTFRKELIFGTLFFLITIGLMIHVIPYVENIVADRHTYLAHIGLFFVIGQFYAWVSEGRLMPSLQPSTGQQRRAASGNRHSAWEIRRRQGCLCSIANRKVNFGRQKKTPGRNLKLFLNV